MAFFIIRPEKNYKVRKNEKRFAFIVRAENHAEALATYKEECLPALYGDVVVDRLFENHSLYSKKVDKITANFGFGCHTVYNLPLLFTSLYHAENEAIKFANRPQATVKFFKVAGFSK